MLSLWTLKHTKSLGGAQSGCPSADARTRRCDAKLTHDPHVIIAKSRSASMLDLVYILIGILLFVACWASTKACDRL
jgi:hypothetical protein